MDLILDDVKNYLRVDSDLTEDDAQIQTLIDAAKLDIVQQTGKTYVDDGLYNQAIKLLVSHWYENRELNPSKPGSATRPMAPCPCMRAFSGPSGN